MKKNLSLAGMPLSHIPHSYIYFPKYTNNDSDIFENEISLLNQSTENVKNEYEDKVNEMILNLEGDDD